MDHQLEVMVFSKDRAAQLELLLRSIKRFCADWERIRWTVVHKGSTPEYALGYAVCRDLHPEFAHVDEDAYPQLSFHEIVLANIGDSPYFAFLVDDNVFKEPFELDSAEMRRFAADPEIACLSLRMAPRMDRCHPMQIMTPPPEFEDGTVWRWAGHRGDWGYPMSIDFHIFRREDIVPLLVQLPFQSPNWLESMLAANPLSAPKMICFEESKVVNLPVNRVQDTHPNPHAGTHGQDELNAGFLAGRRLALEHLVGVENLSPHFELPLRWEDDEAAPEDGSRGFVGVAYVDEVIERPALLETWSAAFSGADDATLVLYAPDGEADAIPDALEAVAEAAGVNDPGGADVMVLAVPAAVGDEALGASAVVMSAREARAGLEWVPHLDDSAGAVLRELYESKAALSEATAPPPVPTGGLDATALAAMARSLAPHASPADRAQYVEDALSYQAAGGDPLTAPDLMPMLHDKGVGNPYDQHYFFQDVWAARRVADRRPARHVDVASRVDLVGFLTALTDVVFVDIRPLTAEIENLECVVGTAHALPFDDRSLESVSCLHVAEHIGLGRYGDPIDPLGTVKAAAELQRVLADDGELLFSVPVGRPRVCFNAHRIFAPAAVPEMFPELEVVEFAGVDDLGQFRRHRGLDELEGSRYACGMYRLRRPAA